MKKKKGLAVLMALTFMVSVCGCADTGTSSAGGSESSVEEVTSELDMSAADQLNDKISALTLSMNSAAAVETSLADLSEIMDDVDRLDAELDAYVDYDTLYNKINTFYSGCEGLINNASDDITAGTNLMDNLQDYTYERSAWCEDMVQWVRDYCAYDMPEIDTSALSSIFNDAANLHFDADISGIQALQDTWNSGITYEDLMGSVGSEFGASLVEEVKALVEEIQDYYGDNGEGGMIINAIDGSSLSEYLDKIEQKAK